jgi:hypothetical protein
MRYRYCHRRRMSRRRGAAIDATGCLSDFRQCQPVRAGMVEDVTTNTEVPAGSGAGVAALNDERRYQAAVSKDPRFDGVFFIAVTSTGI